MPASDNRLIFGRFRPVDLARLLLVVLPTVPGLLFLAVGLMLDMRARNPGSSRWEASARARADAQVRGLYLAGAVTLLGGTIGMGVVVWKIARTSPQDDEQTLGPESGRDS